MKSVLLQRAIKLNKEHKRRKGWQRVVSVLAAGAVFVTTYALILPAITMTREPICGLEAHEHGESCYEQRTVYELNCTLDGSADIVLHTHGDACYDETGTLRCTLDEIVSHTHSDACGEGCTLEELTLHTHGEGCYGEDGGLTCGLPQIVAHDHSGCLTATEQTVSVLTCTIPEHIHEDSCYPLDSDDTVTFLCGSGEHTHGDACLDESGSLTCSIPEHTHEAACVIEAVDLTADLESAAQWEAMAAELSLTGQWRLDLLTLVGSQLGYAESSRNCVFTGGELRGYTRYGDWYGNPYMKWDDAFILFCLRYAGIPEEAIPGDSDSGRWLAQLEQMRIIHQDAPKAGDILFCRDSAGGIFTAVLTSADSGSGNLTVIAGDANDRVGSMTVKASQVTAVCGLDLARERYEAYLAGTLNEWTAQHTTESGDTQTTDPEAPQTLVQTAETDHYIVTVSYDTSLNLPAGAELRVTEYPKDSEIYAQRCREAGYELEWLLNIGFWLDGSELTLNGSFDVVVTSKDGASLGQNVTHFASDGAEHLTGSREEAGVAFTTGSFSDYGGGIMLAAETVTGFNFVTVNPANLTEGVDYIIYCEVGGALRLLDTSLKAGVSVYNHGAGSALTTHGASWSLSTGQLGTSDAKPFTWRVVKQNGQTYLVNQSNNQRLTLNNGWLQLTNEGTAITVTPNGTGAIVGGYFKLRYDDQWRGTWEDNGNYTTPTPVYFATTAEQIPNYPHAVHTGTVTINRLRFYNLCENGDQGVSALAGCVFKITGDNGYEATVVSGKDPEVNLPSGIPDGTYTITEVSVPEGYIRDTEFERTFEIKEGRLVSDNTIGTFINHNIEQLVTAKSAEVEDYANRIYQVNISAKSNMKTYEMEPIDVLFVVDQSNSMLFPSGLVDTGKKVTLRLNGTNNVRNMDNLNLDKSQVYYVVADPTGTSTVWAVWHNGSTWLCQDASYYAKARHSNDPGYQDPNETVIFPQARSYNDQKNAEPSGTRSNGCGLGFNLSGGSLGKDIDAAYNDTKTYTVYTATDEFNRLHYLEEALANLIYQMADVNDKNRITLTPFTKEVVSSQCNGPLDLTPENTEKLVNAVTSIKTSGGTRQDIALKHVFQEHLNDEGEHYSDIDHTYTLLITDGAPVLSSNGGLTELGSPNDAATTTGDSVYGQIKGWAAEVRKDSTLMTVGLGMGSVEAGRDVLEQIASGGNYYCALDDASDLLEFVQKLLFESFRPKDQVSFTGDIVDEISDSFYPIAWVSNGSGAASGRRVLVSDSSRDWVLLQAGDWITLEGKLTSADASDAAGQLLQKDDGTFYIQWKQQYISDAGWNGQFYVKAKEDFIGGNAIDTNKSASVTVGTQVKTMETPTVNVRLLDMNEISSEVTVYLGDTVNADGDHPQDSLMYFYHNTVVTKLIAGDGDVLNKVAGADGLESDSFYLRYAMGADLNEAQWALLLDGNTVQVPYTYDDASSHGAVGYFTFRLEKSGVGSSYSDHQAVSDCQPGGHPLTENCDDPVETYTLHVTYTAYRLGEQGRPAQNVHNGTPGPGREVGTGTTLPTGMGTVAKHNVHEVHVISGRIEITKKFADGTTDEADRTFTFTLHRVEDGPDTSGDVTKTITIPAGSAQGSASIVFDHLKRGTYTVTEAVDEDYAVQAITVLGSTNCYSEPAIGGSAATVKFTMGNNVGSQNVIGKAGDDRYTSYTDPVNGVYGAAEFTNTPIIYTAELPVEKIWNDSYTHQDDAVYVALYLDDLPVLDSDGNARLLRLDAASGWKGVFTIVLADKSDSLSNYNYSVREASRVDTAGLAGWQAAVLENDGTALYYERALEARQLIAINGNGYMVDYGVGADGQLTVTNHPTVTLPSTGGMGTSLFTFGGLLLMAAALMYVFYFGRKRQKGGV